MPPLAMTDHGNMHGAYDFYKQATGAGVKPIIGIEGYVTPGSPVRPRTRVDWGDDLSTRRATASNRRQGRVHPQDHAGPRPPRACTTCSGSPRWPASRASYRKPRMDRDLLERVRHGPHRHHRLPLRRGADPAAARPVRRGAQGGRRVPGHLRQGELLLELMDHGLEIERGSATALLEIAQGARHPAAGHQRLALHARGGADRPRRAAVHPDRRERCPTPTASGSTATATTSRPPPRCARCSPATWQEGCANTLLVAEQCEVHFTEGAAT